MTCEFGGNLYFKLASSMILPLLLSAGLMLSAESTPAAGAAPPAAEAPAKPKKICTTTTELGSRLPVRVCRTPEEVAALAQASKEAVQDLQKVGPAK